MTNLAAADRRKIWIISSSRSSVSIKKNFQFQHTTLAQIGAALYTLLACWNNSEKMKWEEEKKIRTNFEIVQKGTQTHAKL